MASDPRPSSHRSSADRPPVRRSTGAWSAFALAAGLVAPFALIACGGANGPASHPGTATPAAAGSDAPETEPVNASPEATAAAPAPAAEPPAAASRTPPPPPEVEPRSEWTIDDSIETPHELRGREILAKIRKGDKVVIIYRGEGGLLFRRVQGRMGAYLRVEESIIDEPEP